MKYLGVIIQKDLNWHHQINNVAAKLNIANAILSKIRHFVNFNTLKSIYGAIHESHLNFLLTKTNKDFWSYKRNPYELCIFLKRNAHTSILISLKI